MEETKTLSPYRWVIEILLFLLLFSQAVTWLAPAPILAPIIKSLGLKLGQAGLIISIIALCISIFSLLGAMIAGKLGALRAAILGIWLMAIAQVLSGFTHSFGALLACRVVEGIGFGVVIAPPGTLTMQWFGEHEWPYINMINALCSYIGLTAVFSVTAPLFHFFGDSWQSVLFWYGVMTVGIALAWTVLGKEREATQDPSVGAVPGGSALGDVVKMRDVLLIAIGLFGGMWVFQLYTAFLPTYFHDVRGLNLADASAMTAVLPLTGIFAAVGGGMGTGFLKLRKPFTWPIAILTLIGCVGAVVMTDPAMIRFSLVLVGIGAAGSLAAITTLLMELPGMTPAKMGAGLAFVWSVGYAGAFTSPFLGGVAANFLGLRTVMLGFLVFQFLPIGAMYLLPETGPGRTRMTIAPAAEALSKETVRPSA
jgi:predicted MFS family arabinose efflux permease